MQKVAKIKQNQAVSMDIKLSEPLIKIISEPVNLNLILDEKMQKSGPRNDDQYMQLIHL